VLQRSVVERNKGECSVCVVGCFIRAEIYMYMLCRSWQCGVSLVLVHAWLVLPATALLYPFCLEDVQRMSCQPEYGTDTVTTSNTTVPVTAAQRDRPRN
jgi:hypothetical protein